MTVSVRRPPTDDGRLLARVPAARRGLWLAVGAGMLAAIAVVVGAFAMSIVVADVVQAGGSLGSSAGLLAVVAAAVVVRACLGATQEVAAARASTALKGELRDELIRRIIALGPTALGRARRGELASVLGDGLDDLDVWMTSFLPARSLAVAVPAIVLLVILVLDPPTAVVLLLTGPVLVLLLAVIGGRARAVSDRRARELRWLSGFFLDMLRGIATLKAFGRSSEQVETMRDISRRYGETTMEVLRTAFQTSLVLEWGAAIAMAIVAVEVSLRLLDGAITFERALAVLIITPESFLPLRQLATRYHAGAAGRTAAEAIWGILDTPLPKATETPGSADPGSPAPGSAPVPRPDRADIRLVGVTVRYPDRSRPALDGLDLTIRAGRRTAIVGPTGAGKSTLVGVLLGIVPLDAGRILVGGVPLETVDPADWRRSVAWVPQSPYLFHGTMADDLRLGRPDATDTELHAALHAAGADDIVTRLPGGLDASVGEGGSRVSGGERQRLGIARAFVRDAPFVILDEPTAHLDRTDEAAIDSALGRLAGGRTVLIVSHRLRLARSSDEVVVLDAGRIVEQGPPDALLRAGGAFARLVSAEEMERPWGVPGIDTDDADADDADDAAPMAVEDVA